MDTWVRRTLAVSVVAGLGLAAPARAQVVAWTARYNGGFQDADSSPAGKRSIAMDLTGNVYVTGSADNGNDSDWRTIKYGPDGSVIWSVPYYGPGFGFYGGAVALALDAEGHVYVTGTSGYGATTDFWTIKYLASDGSVIWSVGHDSPWHAHDAPRALAVDGAGNVYVTGITQTGGDSDFYTVKQAASDGRVLWAARYTGTSGGGGADEPVAIAVDAAGDAYVTGKSRGVLNDDFRTIKYASSNGSVLWSVAFDGGAYDVPVDLAVDSAGNAYVTGRNGGDMRTIKYASGSGAVLWSVAITTLFHLAGFQFPGGVVLVPATFKNIVVPETAHVLVGAALALLLVFRTNSSYDRFWEGRKLWGGIVNETRNLVRSASVLLADDPLLVRELMLWTSGFAWTAMGRLRNSTDRAAIFKELPPDAVDRVFAADHVPLAVCRRITFLIEQARLRGMIDSYRLGIIDQNVQLLMDYIGACERIRSTPMPYAYAVHLRRALIFYCFTLPFALIPRFGWDTPLAVLLTCYIFFGIEEIGVEIEDPFGEDENDLPLESICAAIEATLRDVVE